MTGGLCCGKTTVCQLLKEHGAYTLSADEIIHDLYSPETAIGKRVIGLLGPDVVVAGVFDRKKIASKVFGNRSLLRQLEEILHPEVQKVIQTHFRKVTEKNQTYPLFVVEIPLLFESELHEYYDTIIAVVADEDICRARFVSQRLGSKEDFQARVERMLPLEQKAERADIVLPNNGTREELKKEVDLIFKTLSKK